MHGKDGNFQCVMKWKYSWDTGLAGEIFMLHFGFALNGREYPGLLIVVAALPVQSIFALPIWVFPAGIAQFIFTDVTESSKVANSNSFACLNLVDETTAFALSLSMLTFPSSWRTRLFLFSICLVRRLRRSSKADVSYPHTLRKCTSYCRLRQLEAAPYGRCCYKPGLC